jgi:hypothetical protein
MTAFGIVMALIISTLPINTFYRCINRKVNMKVHSGYIFHYFPVRFLDFEYEFTYNLFKEIKRGGFILNIKKDGV